MALWEVAHTPEVRDRPSSSGPSSCVPSRSHSCLGPVMTGARAAARSPSLRWAIWDPEQERNPQQRLVALLTILLPGDPVSPQH